MYRRAAGGLQDARGSAKAIPTTVRSVLEPFRGHNTAGCPYCSIAFVQGAPTPVSATKDSMDHRAHCRARGTDRGCRDLVWAASLAQHLPANYWRPRPEAPHPPPAFLPPDDGTAALLRGPERHPRLPGVLRSTNRPHNSFPTALLAAYAAFYGDDASSQPEKFVHDVSVHLCNAMHTDPHYSECRHLPPALELCLCRRLGLRRLGPSWFALHCRAVYGGRAPALLAPLSGPSPWLFGGSGAADLGPLMVATSGPPGRALAL